MLKRTIKHFSSLAAAREKAIQKNLQYISRIQIVENFSKKEATFICNGKTLKFGDFEALSVPNRLVGDLVMFEWKNQAMSGQKLDIPHDIKAILAKSSDLKNGKLAREDVYDDIFKYLTTDTLLFWEEESSLLREWQNDTWAKALLKLSQALKLPPFKVTDGIFQIQQDEKILHELSSFLEELSNYQLAAFDYAVKSLKSVILGWGLFRDVFSLEEAAKASLLELQYQGNRWGRRPEYHDLTEAELLRRISAVKLFIS